MIELADQSLKTFGVPQPRIPVAGINPHSSEGGLFGTAEQTDSVPATNGAKARGIDAPVSVPADIVFLKARDEQYDLVVAMFEDQVNMASKLLGFGEVVTLLAGLPIIRISVGHGPDFVIAGKANANELNIFCAIKSAPEFAVMKKEGRQCDLNHIFAVWQYYGLFGCGLVISSPPGRWPRDANGLPSVARVRLDVRSHTHRCHRDLELYSLAFPIARCWASVISDAEAPTGTSDVLRQ